MPWNVDLTGNIDWSSKGVLDQFVNAVLEREKAAGYSSGQPSPAVGDDIQEGGFNLDAGQWRIAFLQAEVDDLAPAFVNPDKRLDFQSGGGVNFTLSEWRAKAGIPSGGFTRKYPDGNGGLTTDTGYFQPGDIVGAWLFKEMHDGLNLLLELATSSWRGPGAEQNEGNDDGESNFADAKAGALADYPGGNATSVVMDFDTGIYGGLTRSDSTGTQHAATLSNNAYILYREHGYSAPGNAPNAVGDVWVKADVPGRSGVFAAREFDANGYGVVNGSWAKIRTDAPALPDGATGFGDPAWKIYMNPNHPTYAAPSFPSATPADGEQTIRGFEFDGEFAFIRPSFEYQ
jgi:hypothetical protein